jgi:hypothetical protein
MPTALFGLGLGGIFAVLTSHEFDSRVYIKTVSTFMFFAAAAVAKYLGL